MELRHLRYFVMAAVEGNISRASSRLYVSQPAVSRQIKDLEDELGVILFLRKSNGLSLTEAGTEALVYAREILRQSKRMSEAMQNLGRPDKLLSLKVGFLPTALPCFLAEGMRKFQQAEPTSCLQIFEMSQSEQEEALQSGDIDLGLIGSIGPKVKQSFAVETIRQVEMAVVVPDHHRLAKRKSVNLSELGNDTFVTLEEKHFPGRSDMMADMFCRAEIHPTVTLPARGLSELLGLVGAGAGVALAPADLIQLPHSGVVFIKLKKPKLTLPFSAAWRKTGDLSVVEAFITTLKGIDKPNG